MTWVDGALLLGARPVSFSDHERAQASTALRSASPAANAVGRSLLGRIRGFDRIGEAERKPYSRPEVRSSAGGGAAAIGVLPRGASRAIDGFEKYRFHLLHPVGRPLRG